MYNLLLYITPNKSIIIKNYTKTGFMLFSFFFKNQTKANIWKIGLELDEGRLFGPEDQLNSLF